ncbi:hypothetical protein [Nostocoides sp. Soil756]|uniref:hypothetical protein n=1 Tax=Nostocoides sp. Soil756 TaxID=1736399 RepID=UPI0006FF5786|nr:hypothetical protein [Tetrasphaera sp. Soil756]KRE61955.1 hypothetical protein ASG78_02375 [Tetrasphaera sp. Soil756]
MQVQKHGGSTALISDGGQGSDAEVRGVVQMAAGGCWGIVPEGSDAAVPAIWPEGATVSQDGTSIEIPDVGTVRAGSTVVGAGGEISDPSGDRYTDVPAACLEQKMLVDVAKLTAVT